MLPIARAGTPGRLGWDVLKRQGRTRSGNRLPSLAALAAALAIAAAAITGCQSEAGKIASTVDTALHSSSSAIATAQLALSLEQTGKLTHAATSTALDDALEELETSRKSVLQLAPETQETRGHVQEALKALDLSATSLTTARHAIASKDQAPQKQAAQTQLDQAAKTLEALTHEAQQ